MDREPITFRRVSTCCNASIVHLHPWQARGGAVEAIHCAKCWEEVQDFRVVGSNGMVVWPVPEDFEVPESFKGNDLANLWGNSSDE